MLYSIHLLLITVVFIIHNVVGPKMNLQLGYLWPWQSVRLGMPAPQTLTVIRV